MRRFLSAPLALALVLSSTAPSYAAERAKHRKVSAPSSFADAERYYSPGFAERPAITRIRVPGNFFLSKPIEKELPASLAQRQLRLELRGDKPTVADLIALIEAQNVPVAVDWRALGEPSDDQEKVGSWTVASRYQSVPNDIRSGGTSGQQFSQGQFNGGVSSANGSGVASSGGTITSGNGLPPIKGAAEETIDPKFAGAERGQVKPIAERAAPFRFFQGTVAQLARRLEAAGNMAVWFDDGLVIGAQRRYSVSVLQNQDVVQSVVNELKRLGATDVVGSVGAGQITYSASPRLVSEVIEPYLARVQSNLSEVRLQVALVAVRMSREAERGFDWSKLNFQFGVVPGGGAGGASLPGDSGGFRGTARTPTTLFGVNPQNFEVADLQAKLFGITRPLSVTGAIRFLSTLGESEVTQNVELPSIAGAPVTLRSGQSIPYATGVQANPIGGIGGVGTVASSQTDFLETGLTVNFEPRFDASSGIVTIDIGLMLVELEQFVQVSAGNQIGELTQPQVSRQGTNAIVRVPAGQTTIIGGVRRDATSDDKNGPLGIFAFGSRKRSRNVFWLFTVVRPVVTSYETADQPTGEAVQGVGLQTSSLTRASEAPPSFSMSAPVDTIKVAPLPAKRPPATAPAVQASVSLPARLEVSTAAVTSTAATPVIEIASAAPAAPPPAPKPEPKPEPKPTVPAFVTRPMSDAERAAAGQRGSF